MFEIKVFKHPDSACYTFALFAILSVFIGYVITDPALGLVDKIWWLVGIFGLLCALLIICKVIGKIADILDNFFDKRK